MSEAEIILPKHIAIISDGNRRWAKERGLPSLVGHQKGAEAFKTISRHLKKRGVKHLTAWAFSTENWKRTAEEKSYLFELIGRFLQDLTDEAVRDGIRFRQLGRKDRLPAKLLELVTLAEERTKSCDEFHLNIAIDYGGRDEILRAIKKWSDSGKPELNEESFAGYLDTAGQPDVDMLIRTGGEQRTSGYLPWQLTYAEMFFVEKYLPGFTTEDMDALIEEFIHRQRRFGK